MAGQPEGRDTFSRAYVGLRGELAKASRPVGTQIRVDETARAYGMSATPVREALARLAGERLVRGCRRHGYYVPKYSGAELAQLYELAHRHLQLALAAMIDANTLSAALLTFSHANDIEAGRMFVSLLASSKLGIVLDAGALAVERLATARHAEPTIIDTSSELATLLTQAASGDQNGFTAAIASYFKLRIKNAELIASALEGPPATGFIPDMA